MAAAVPTAIAVGRAGRAGIVRAGQALPCGRRRPMNVLINVEYTPDDLLRMTGGPRYELVNGRLVEKAMSLAAAKVGSRLIRLLDTYADANSLGSVFDPNAGYQAFPHEP